MNQKPFSENHPFTLIEVITAFFIFSIGTGFLLTQFSQSQYRVADSTMQWRQTHELINAAEIALLSEPSAALDSRFLDEQFMIHREYSDPVLERGFENPVNGLQLKVLTLSLYDRINGKKLDEMSVDCWRDSNCGNPKNEK